MAVYKRGNTWWYKFNWRGERIYESARTKNKRVARDIEAARKTQLARGEVGLQDYRPTPTLRRFATERFIPHIEVNKCEKPRTVEFYKNCVKNLLAFERLANSRLDAIDGALIDAFIKSRRAEKRQTSTINRDLAGLRRLLRYAASEEVDAISRPAKVTLLKGENVRERVITHAEEAVYLRHAVPLLADFAVLSLDCGLRPEEIYRLEWTQWKDSAVQIYTGKTPAARRSVPASPRVVEMFERRHARANGSRWVFPAARTATGHICSLARPHAQAVKAANVTPFPPYTLRHTALTRWAQSGMDVWTLKRLAGHEKLQTTLRYIHMNSADDRTAMEKTWKVPGGDKSGDSRKSGPK